MPFKLFKTRLDGVRGINQPITIEMDKQLTIFHGPNGSGKTSILNAIQWGLTGDIPHMRGGDYGNEDAIVNAFCPDGLARVDLFFTGPERIKITREKKRTKRTRSKAQSLIFDDGTIFENTDAENEIETRFNLDLDDINRTKFLPQESIREALSYKPTDRSAFIEKILGTYEIKDLARSMNQKNLFRKELENIKHKIQTITETREEYINNLQTLVWVQENTLIENGFDESNHNIGWIKSQVKGILNEMRKIAKVYNYNLREKTFYDLNEEDINAYLNQFSVQIDQMDRARLEEKQLKEDQIDALEKLKDYYTTYLTNNKKYDKFDKKKSLDNLKIITENINELSKKKEKIEQINAKLPSHIDLYNQFNKQLEEEQTQYDSILSKYGTVHQITNNIDSNNEQIKKTELKISVFSNHEQIVNRSISYLEQKQSTSCPICSQSINPTSLISSLKNSLSKDISQQIEEMRKEIVEKSNDVNIKKGLLNEIRITQDSINNVQDRLSRLSKEMVDYLEHNFDPGRLDSLSVNYINEKKQIDLKLNKEIENTTNINNDISEYDAIIELKKQLDLLIKNILNEDPNKIDVLITTNKKIMEYRKIFNVVIQTNFVDDVRDKIQHINLVNQFVTNKYKLQQKQKEMNENIGEVSELETKITQINALKDKIDKINSLLMIYQKTVSDKQIQVLEEKMNEYYTIMLAHPHYNNLKIHIEKLDPLQFSFRIKGNGDEAYLATRLSTAQLNVVAISIFLSNSFLLVGELPIIIMDDPTQNMDDQHKAAFASLISRITETFQVIIATEDPQTVNHLENKCKGITYQLTDWAPEGPKINLLS